MKALIALAALLLAAPASADLWTAGCAIPNSVCTGVGAPFDCCLGAGTGTCPVTQDAGVVGKTTIRALEKGCWWFNNADGTMDSLAITATTNVRVCLNPNLAAAGSPIAADGEVHVHRCHAGVKPTANPDNLCQNLGGSINGKGELEGIEGDPATQNMCKVLTPGMIYFGVHDDCDAAKTCVVTVEGIDPTRQ